MTKPTVFSKKNVLLAIKTRKEDIVWRKNHLPLADTLREKLMRDLDILDSLENEIREMIFE